MRSRSEILSSLVSNWTKDQCLTYLAGLSLESLKDDCLSNLEAEFNDCETEADVRSVANMDYLISPKPRL